MNELTPEQINFYRITFYCNYNSNIRYLNHFNEIFSDILFRIFGTTSVAKQNEILKAYIEITFDFIAIEFAIFANRANILDEKILSQIDSDGCKKILDGLFKYRSLARLKELLPTLAILIENTNHNDLLDLLIKNKEKFLDRDIIAFLIPRADNVSIALVAAGLSLTESDINRLDYFTLYSFLKNSDKYHYIKKCNSDLVSKVLEYALIEKGDLTFAQKLYIALITEPSNNLKNVSQINISNTILNSMLDIILKNGLHASFLKMFHESPYNANLIKNLKERFLLILRNYQKGIKNRATIINILDGFYNYNAEEANSIYKEISSIEKNINEIIFSTTEHDKKTLSPINLLQLFSQLNLKQLNAVAKYVIDSAKSKQNITFQDYLTHIYHTAVTDIIETYCKLQLEKYPILSQKETEDNIKLMIDTYGLLTTSIILFQKFNNGLTLTNETLSNNDRFVEWFLWNPDQEPFNLEKNLLSNFYSIKATASFNYYVDTAWVNNYKLTGPLKEANLVDAISFLFAQEENIQITILNSIPEFVSTRILNTLFRNEHYRNDFHRLFLKLNQSKQHHFLDSNASCSPTIIKEICLFYMKFIIKPETAKAIKNIYARSGLKLAEISDLAVIAFLFTNDYIFPTSDRLAVLKENPQLISLVTKLEEHQLAALLNSTYEIADVKSRENLLDAIVKSFPLESETINSLFIKELVKQNIFNCLAEDKQINIIMSCFATAFNNNKDSGRTVGLNLLNTSPKQFYLIFKLMQDDKVTSEQEGYILQEIFKSEKIASVSLEKLAGEYRALTDKAEKTQDIIAIRNTYYRILYNFFNKGTNLVSGAFKELLSAKNTANPKSIPGTFQNTIILYIHGKSSNLDNEVAKKDRVTKICNLFAQQKDEEILTKYFNTLIDTTTCNEPGAQADLNETAMQAKQKELALKIFEHTKPFSHVIDNIQRKVLQALAQKACTLAPEASAAFINSLSPDKLLDILKSLKSDGVTFFYRCNINPISQAEALFKLKQDKQAKVQLQNIIESYRNSTDEKKEKNYTQLINDLIVLSEKEKDKDTKPAIETFACEIFENLLKYDQHEEALKVFLRLNKKVSIIIWERINEQLRLKFLTFFSDYLFKQIQSGNASLQHSAISQIRALIYRFKEEASRFKYTHQNLMPKHGISCQIVYNIFSNIENKMAEKEIASIIKQLFSFEFSPNIREDVNFVIHIIRQLSDQKKYLKENTVDKLTNILIEHILSIPPAEMRKILLNAEKNKDNISKTLFEKIVETNLVTQLEKQNFFANIFPSVNMESSLEQQEKLIIDNIQIAASIINDLPKTAELQDVANSLRKLIMDFVNHQGNAKEISLVLKKYNINTPSTEEIYIILMAKMLCDGQISIDNALKELKQDPTAQEVSITDLESIKAKLLLKNLLKAQKHEQLANIIKHSFTDKTKQLDALIILSGMCENKEDNDTFQQIFKLIVINKNPIADAINTIYKADILSLINKPGHQILFDNFIAIIFTESSPKTLAVNSQSPLSLAIKNLVEDNRNDQAMILLKLHTLIADKKDECYLASFKNEINIFLPGYSEKISLLPYLSEMTSDRTGEAFFKTFILSILSYYNYPIHLYDKIFTALSSEIKDTIKETKKGVSVNKNMYQYPGMRLYIDLLFEQKMSKGLGSIILFLCSISKTTNHLIDFLNHLYKICHNNESSYKVLKASLSEALKSKSILSSASFINHTQTMYLGLFQLILELLNFDLTKVSFPLSHSTQIYLICSFLIQEKKYEELIVLITNIASDYRLLNKLFQKLSSQQSIISILNDILPKAINKQQAAQLIPLLDKKIKSNPSEYNLALLNLILKIRLKPEAVNDESNNEKRAQAEKAEANAINDVFSHWNIFSEELKSMLLAPIVTHNMVNTLSNLFIKFDSDPGHFMDLIYSFYSRYAHENIKLQILSDALNIYLGNIGERKSEIANIILKIALSENYIKDNHYKELVKYLLTFIINKNDKTNSQTSKAISNILIYKGTLPQELKSTLLATIVDCAMIDILFDLFNKLDSVPNHLMDLIYSLYSKFSSEDEKLEKINNALTKYLKDSKKPAITIAIFIQKIIASDNYTREKYYKLLVNYLLNFPISNEDVNNPQTSKAINNIILDWDNISRDSKSAILIAIIDCAMVDELSDLFKKLDSTPNHLMVTIYSLYSRFSSEDEKLEKINNALTKYFDSSIMKIATLIKHIIYSGNYIKGNHYKELVNYLLTFIVRERNFDESQTYTEIRKDFNKLFKLINDRKVCVAIYENLKQQIINKDNSLFVYVDAWERFDKAMNNISKDDMNRKQNHAHPKHANIGKSRGKRGPKLFDNSYSYQELLDEEYLNLDDLLSINSTNSNQLEFIDETYSSSNATQNNANKK